MSVNTGKESFTGLIYTSLIQSTYFFNVFMNLVLFVASNLEPNVAAIKGSDVEGTGIQSDLRTLPVPTKYDVDSIGAAGAIFS